MLANEPLFKFNNIFAGFPGVFSVGRDLREVPLM